jgi:hypothetical protein
MVRWTSSIDHASQSQTTVPDNSTVTHNTLKNVIVDDPETIHSGTVNATLYTLVVDPVAQHDEVLKTVKSFDLHFALGDRTYDWVFITPYRMSEIFKHEIRSEWRGAVRFVGVADEDWWDLPFFLEEEALRSRIDALKKDKAKHADDMEFRRANRFHAILAPWHPVLAQYQYGLRVDPGIELLGDVPVDVFGDMQARQAVYGFTHVMPNKEKEADNGLWSSVRSFAEFRPHSLPQDSMAGFVSSDKGESYNSCSFVAKFEIFDFEFYRNGAALELAQWLDREGGFHFELWRATPVSSIITSLSAKPSQILHFTNVGWSGDRKVWCPTDVEVANKIGCEPFASNGTAANPCLSWLIQEGVTTETS